MSMVLVVDQERRLCAPVHPGRARHLLTRGRAAVFQRYPFTLILTAGERAEESAPLRMKIDPGSKTTGLAVVNDATGQVVWAAELAHRGEQVKARLDQRRACRRSRRQRHTRYRPPRFLNRRRSSVRSDTSGDPQPATSSDNRTEAATPRSKQPPTTPPNADGAQPAALSADAPAAPPHARRSERPGKPQPPRRRPPLRTPHRLPPLR